MRQTSNALGMLIRRYRGILRHMAWMEAVLAHPVWSRILRGSRSAATASALASAVALAVPTTTTLTVDGTKTQTTVAGTGPTYTVTTGTVTGKNALNAFTRFDVAQANTVNLVVPTAADNLINVVRDTKVSEIYGTVNGLKGEKIGGNIYFLNPKGVMVGASGVINVGSLTIAAPTQGFVDGFFGNSSGNATTVIEGKVPLGNTGLITVEGKINAMNLVALSAKDVAINHAAIYAGEVARAEFAKLANVASLVPGTAFSVTDGAIRIVASSQGATSASVKVDGASTLKADKAISLAAAATSQNDFNGNETASIELKGGSTLVSGGTLALTALSSVGANLDASEESSLTDAEKAYLEASGSSVVRLLEDMAIPVANLHFENAAASIVIDNCTLTAAQALTIHSKAEFETKVTVFGVVAGFAYGQGAASSNISIKGALTGGSIDVLSETNGILALSTKNTLHSIALSDKVPFDAMVALGITRYTNTITIDKASTLRATTPAAGGAANLSVKARTTSAESVEATAGGEKEALAIAVGIGLRDATTTVSVDGTLEGAVVETKAEFSAQDEMEVRSFQGESFFSPITKPLMATAPVEKVKGFFSGLFTKLFKLKGGPDGAFTSAMKNLQAKVGACGAVGYRETNTATTVSVAGTIKASDKLTVAATATETELRRHVSADVGKNKQLGLGIAVNVDNRSNIVDAAVATGAVLEAGKAISVNAEYSQPYRQTFTDKFTDLAQAANFFEGATVFFSDTVLGTLQRDFGLLEGFFTSGARSAAEGESFAAAASVNIGIADNQVTARVADGASLKTTNAAGAIDIGSKVLMQAVNFSGDFGLPLYTINPKSFDAGFWFHGTQSGNVGAGASYLGNFNTSQAITLVGNATITTKDLTVKAVTEGLAINLALAGGKAGSFGFDGAVSTGFYDDTTIAQISDGAVVTLTGKLDVSATDNLTLVAPQGGICVGNSIGFGVSVGYTSVNRHTAATIGYLDDTSRAKATAAMNRLTGGWTLATGASATAKTFTLPGGLSLRAENKGLLVNIALAGTVIKNADPSKPPTEPTSVSTADMPAPDAALENPGGALPLGDAVKSAKSGMGAGVSGDAAVGVFNDRAEAVVRGSVNLNAAGSSVAVSAVNDDLLVTVAGALTVATKDTLAGIAGSFAFAKSQQDALASIETTGTTTSGSIAVDAERKGLIITVGASINAATSSQKVGIAASGAFNELAGTTQASIKNGTIATGSGAVDVTAIDNATIVSVTGAVSAGRSNVGIGGSFSWNQTDNDTVALLENVRRLDATSLNLLANNNSAVYSIAGAGAVALNDTGLGFGGSFSVNRVLDQAQARITAGSSSVINTKALSVQALDGADGTKSDMTVFSDNAAVESVYDAANNRVAGDTQGVSSSNGNSQVTIETNPNRAAGEAKQTETYTFTNTANPAHAKIVAVNIGFGVGSKAGFGLAGSYNEVTGGASAELSGGVQLTVGGGVAALNAVSNGNLIAVGASAGAAGKAAGAVSVGVNLVNTATNVKVLNGAKLYLDGSAARTLDLLANNQSNLTAIDVAGAGAGTGAAIGTFAYNQFKGDSLVTMSGNSLIEAPARTVNQKTTISLSAKNSGQIVAVGVGGAGAGTGAGAASVGVNRLGGDTLVTIDGSEINPYGSSGDTLQDRAHVLLSSENTRAIRSVAVAGSGAGTAAGAAAVSYNQIGGHNGIELNGGGAKGVFYGYNTLSLSLSVRDAMMGQAIVVGGSGAGTAAFAASAAINTIGNPASSPDTASREQQLLASLNTNPGAAFSDHIVGVESNGFSAGGSMSVDVSGSNNWVAVSVGGAGAGTVAGGLAASYNNIGGRQMVSFLGGEFKTADVFGIRNTAGGQIVSVGGGLSGAGTVAIGAAVLINNFSTETLDRLENVQVMSASDTTISAENSSKIVAVSVGGAGAGTVAIGASGMSNKLRNTVAVDVRNSSINARRNGALRSLVLSAKQTNHIVSTAVAGSGAGVVAVAGAVGVNIDDSVVRVTARDSLLTAYGSTALRSTLDDSLLAIGVGASGAGVVSVAGTVNTNVVGLQNTIEVTGSTLEGGGGSATGATSDGHRGVLLEADTHETLDVITINAGGAGVAAVQAAAGVNVVESTTGVKVERSTLNAKDHDVVARATDRSSGGNYAVSVAGAGAAGVGAGVGTNTFKQQVSATLTDTTVQAPTGDLILAARREQTGRSVVVGAGGGIAGIGGSVAVGYYGGSSRASITGGSVSVGQDANISADGVIDVSGVVGGAAGGVVGLGMGIQVITVEGETSVLLDRPTVTAGRDLSAAAKNDVDVHATVGSGSGGAVAVNGAFNVLGLYDTVSVTANDGTRLEAGRNLSLLATSDLLARDVVGGGAVGIGAFGVSLDVLRAQSSAVVNFRGTAKATQDATFTSTNKRDVEATVVSGTVGGVAVGGAVSVAMIGPSLNPAAAPSIDGYADSSKVLTGPTQNTNTVLNDLTTKQLTGLDRDGAVSSSDSARVTAAVNCSSDWSTQRSSAPSSSVSVIGTVNVGHNLTVGAAGNTRFKLLPVMASAGSYSVGATVAYGERADITSIDVSGVIQAAAVTLTAEDTADESLTLGAGSGGLVGVSAAYGRIYDHSQVLASLRDNTSITTPGTFRLLAASTEQFNTAATLVAAGVVGAGGAGVSVESATETQVDVGTSSQVTADRVDVDATATFRQNSDANKTTANILMPGVGIGAVAVTASVTKVSDNTAVRVRNATLLAGANALAVNAANVLGAYDYVQVVGGGAVAVVNANTALTLGSTAAVNLDGSASLRSTGAIDVGANTTGTAWSKAVGTAGGLGGGAVATVGIGGSVANTVNVAGGTLESTGSQVNVLAGCDKDQADDTLNLTGESRSFAYGVVVVPVTSANTRITQSNWIELGAASRIVAVGDVSVLAGRRGALVSAYYSAKWNGIGGDKQSMTLDDNGGYAGVTMDSKLVASGSIDSGTRDRRELYIDANGNVFYRDPDQAGSTSDSWKLIGSSLARGVSLALTFDARIQQLQADITRYAGDATAVARYQSDLAAVQAMKASYGNRIVDQMTIAPVTLSLHDVRLGAGSISGSGRINASAGSQVKIVNDSSAFLKLGAISIDGTKGFVYFNGVPVTSVTGFGGSIKGILNGNAATVSVANRGASRAMLQVSGDILNPYGSVLLNSTGTVFVDGANLKGATVAISAGGDFIQSYTPGFDQIGGQPAYGQSGGSIISGGSIFIAAEKINVNGTLRSGVDSVTVSITAADVTAALKFSGSADQWIRDIRVDNLYVASLYYNPALHSFKLTDVRLEGGHVELFGNIFSTGSGRIEVFDGSGTVSISNPTAYGLRLAAIDAGQAQGIVRITDTSKVQFGQYVTTEFVRSNGAVAQTSYVMNGASRRVIATSGSSNYQTTLNRQLHWISAVVENKVDLHQEAAKGSDTWVKPIESTVTSQQPITDGGYWLDENASNTTTWTTTVTTNLQDRVNYGEQKVGGKTQRRWETHYTLTTYTHHTIKADNPIAVAFFGSTAGNVSVNSTGPLSVTDSINARGGTAALTGSAILMSGSGYVSGGIINLTAQSGSIGSTQQPLVINASNAVNASAPAGSIALSSLMSDLPVDTITARDTVLLDSQRSIVGVGGHASAWTRNGSAGALKLGSKPHITASSIKLVANGGITGDIDGALGVYNLDASGAPNATTLYAWAGNGAIALAVPTGSLTTGGRTSDTLLDVNLDQILANNGDVTLAMAGARIFDGNGTLALDPLTDEQVRKLWGDVGLTTVSPEQQTQREQALVATRTLEYHQTWGLVNFDRSKYNATYKFAFTASEKDALTAQGQDAAAIAAEEARRTKYYHDTIGVAGATYNSAYQYVLTAAERTALATPMWNVDGLANSAPMAAAGKLGITPGHGMGINELPNIAGKRVTITASSIGSSLGEFLVPANTKWSGLTADQQFAVRMAASGDITVRKVNGADMIVIARHDDIDLIAADGLVLNAGSARVYSDPALFVREVNVKGRSLVTSYDDLLVGGGRLEGDISLYAWNNLYLYGGLTIGKGTIFVEGANDVWVYLPEGVAIPDNIVAAVNAKADQIVTKLKQGVALGDMGFLLDNVVALAGLDYRMAAEKTPKTYVPASLLSSLKKPVLSFTRPKF